MKYKPGSYQLSDAFVEHVAEVAHAANVAHCARHGDTSHKTWAETPNAIKESTRHGVRHALQNPDATAESMQTEWRRFKEADGWTYGPVKDVEKKTHPNLVPYGDLQAHEKAKDELFLGIVRAFEAAYRSVV